MLNDAKGTFEFDLLLLELLFVYLQFALHSHHHCVQLSLGLWELVNDLLVVEDTGVIRMLVLIVVEVLVAGGPR